ncbi:cell division cycle protein [Trypanosoma brucei equiperdum]|uniref:Cell division cycle protein n=1 Tax=Trypanosoma brucei equiperdum TaxID=630700 RepID=A0A3L6LDM7_9TRYP|nr:cell division cycle protein [Trypanosoma brucei equiperdum]
MAYSGAGFLILRAQIAWWPPAAELHRHPLDPKRAFFSAITDGGVSIGAGKQFVSLSRLGKSVVLGGRPLMNCSSSPPCLQVYDPFSGMEITVAFKVEGGLTEGSKQCVLDVSTLREFVNGDRVRVTAAPLTAGVPFHQLQEFLQLDEGEEENDATCGEHHGGHRNHDNGFANRPGNYHSLFGDRYLGVALRHITHRLKCSPRPAVCSVLFSGEHGVGKTYAVRRLLELVPPVVDICGSPHLVERREMSIAALLLLSEQEAVATVQAVFTPPLVEAHHDSGNRVNGAEPCGVLLLVTLDRIDLLVSAANSLVALVTHQLCMVLDELQHGVGEGGGRIVVTLATAESTKSIPTALLARLGQRLVNLAHPTLPERLRFIRTICNDADNLRSYSPCVLERAAEALSGRTAAELQAMKVDEVLQLLEREAALHSKHEPFAKNSVTDVPDEYRGLVGLSDIIREVEELVVWPLQQRKLLSRCGVQPQKGLVVYGPPGSGKTALLTRLARRLKSARVHVLLVDGLSLIEKEVGRTEKNIASLFAAARATSPTALFLDNIDSLAPPRGRETGEVSTTADRSLSTLLTEMDGIGGGHTGSDVPLVFVVAAASNPEALDAAISRPGRLDLHITLPLPTIEALQQHIVRRLVEAVEACDEAEAITADFIANVDAYVMRWLGGSPSATVADANDFVRHILLRVVVEPEGVPGAKDRLLECFTKVLPL